MDISTPGVDLAPVDAADVATPADRLAALDTAATEYVAGIKESNTRRSYESDWRVWQHYCTTIGIPDTANTVGALVGFVKWLENKPPTPADLDQHSDAQPTPQAPSTIDRRLAGVVVTLAEHNAEPSKMARKKAREALDDYRKRLTKSAVKLGRGKAAPAKVNHLRLMAASCPDTLAGARDRALVLLGFRFAARSAEVANLILPDIEDSDQGVVVTVRFGKTGGRRVAIPLGHEVDTCPVRAWRAWRAVAPYSSGPAFVQINRYDNIRRDRSGVPLGLSPQAVRNIIGRAAARADLDRLTGHSLRSGLATEARRAGYDNKTISGITGHTPTSEILFGYFREVDEWVEAPDDIL